MATPEIALNALKPSEHDSRARAYRKTKTLNSLTPLNALNGLEAKEFKGFKEFHCLKASELLEKYRAAGVTFWLEGELVKWRGPSGVFSEADRQTFKELKPIVFLILQAETGAAQSTPVENKSGNISTLKPETEAEQVARIRSMAREVSPELFLAARKKITPEMREGLSSSEVNQLILGEAIRLKRQLEAEAEIAGGEAVS